MIDEIVARISASAPAVKTVTGPTASATLNRDDYPAALVYPASDALDGDRLGYALMRTRIAIEITAEGLDSLMLSRGQIRRSLQDYTPSDARSALAFMGGQIKSIDGSRLIWADNFELKTCL